MKAGGAELSCVTEKEILMKATTLVKGYALEGMTRELAELAVPKDLTGVKKIEVRLADAILADRRAGLEERGCQVHPMKRRIANIKRGSNYFDCYLSQTERMAQPRGIIVSYPEGGGFGRWHGSRWTSDERLRFDQQISDARKALVEWLTENREVRDTQRDVFAIGEEWVRAVGELVKTLQTRLAEN